MLKRFARVVSAAVGLIGEFFSSSPRSHLSLAPPRPKTAEIVELDGTVYGIMKRTEVISVLAFSLSFSGGGDGGKEDIISKACPVTCVRVFEKF